jgi:hypothetical protein
MGGCLRRTHIADVDDHVEDGDQGDGETRGAGEGPAGPRDLAEHVVALVEAVVRED